MALVKATLEAAISAALDAASADAGATPKARRDQIAADLATAFDAYVKSATVAVVGTSATGGPVTGTGTIS